MWITFWREFWGVFLGDFWEPTGPGAGVRGDFSADGVLLVRWASADFDFFRGFFTLLDRFLPVFVPYFALFPSMSCAYLYVHNFLPANVSGEGETARPSTQSMQGTQGGDSIAARGAPMKEQGDCGLRNETTKPRTVIESGKTNVMPGCHGLLVKPCANHGKHGLRAIRGTREINIGFAGLNSRDPTRPGVVRRTKPEGERVRCGTRNALSGRV